MGEMKSKVMMVDPALALAWLQRNIATNRPVRKGVVNAYAEVMKRGEWQLTHQGVALDINGNLIDGQHRLQAVVEANVIIPMMVTVNAPERSFSALDGGVKRTTADRLTMNPQVCAAINLAVQIGHGHSRRVTEGEVMAVAESQFGIYAETIIPACTTHKRVMSSAAVAVAAIVACCEGQSVKHAIELRRVLIMQDERNETNAAAVFRRRFQNASISGYISSHEIMACALRVFEKDPTVATKITLKDGWQEKLQARVVNALNKESN